MKLNTRNLNTRARKIQTGEIQRKTKKSATGKYKKICLYCKNWLMGMGCPIGDAKNCLQTCEKWEVCEDMKYQLQNGHFS